MWNGAVVFGDCWVGYLGGTDQNSSHAHSATQLAIGISDEVAITFSDGTVQGRVLFIAPGVRHMAQEMHGQVMFLYLSPQTHLSRALLARFGSAGVASLDAALPETLFSVSDFAGIIVELSYKLCVEQPLLDFRLEAALNFLKNNVGGTGNIIARAAHAAGLSEPRLRALAKNLLGVSLSQWLLWRKLELAATAIAAGLPLAAAAAEGGFADQAHLSRTMRGMFGVTPTDATHPLQARKRFVQDIR